MLGKAVFVLAGLFVQHWLKAILRAVRLVGDDHDVGAVGQHGECLFILFAARISAPW